MQEYIILTFRCLQCIPSYHLRGLERLEAFGIHRCQVRYQSYINNQLERECTMIKLPASSVVPAERKAMVLGISKIISLELLTQLGNVLGIRLLHHIAIVN